MDADINQNSEAGEEHDWLRAAVGNPAFEFLEDEEEDIYTLSDGKPFMTTENIVPGVQD